MQADKLRKRGISDDSAKVVIKVKLLPTQKSSDLSEVITYPKKRTVLGVGHPWPDRFSPAS